jgi:hypothetical protein
MSTTYQRLDVQRCQPREMPRERRAGGLETEAGEAIGRDPRTLSPTELQALGHAAASLTEVIRAKCLDCCCGSAHEVRRCISIDCALWPFRMGANPWRKPISEEERQRRAERLRNTRALLRSPESSQGSSASEEVPATPLPANP